MWGSMFTDSDGCHYRGIVEKIPVLWIPGKILALPSKGTFGVCCKTKRIFKITKNLFPTLIFNDILIDKLRCEEKERCLNIKCSLNQSTAKSLRISKKAFSQLPVEEHWPELTSRLEELCSKNPKGGLLIEKSKRTTR
jgi:hypothetical protein